MSHVLLFFQIHQFVSQPNNGYDTSILAHSVAEVGVLLGYEHNSVQ